MARQAAILLPSLKLNELFEYQKDVESSLRLYFSAASPSFAVRFVGYSSEEVNALLTARLQESDLRSSLAVLTSLEAHFRVDFDMRCRKKLKDPLSRQFRKLQQTNATYVRLDRDILESWKEHSTVSSLLIGDLRGAFRFRHWAAHGRYWTPDARKYDFQALHLLATSIEAGFPFVT